MRAEISVVIPTLNAGADLPKCLIALFEGVEAGVIRELIVSDGGSVDATIDIAQEAGAVVVRGDASRGGQLRRGGAVCGGEWILFLHSDTVLPDEWSDVLMAHMANFPGHAGSFRLGFMADGLAPMFVAAWANVRSKMGLPYGDQAMFVPRALYEQVGGYPDIPLMEDVALARALRGRMRALPATVKTSAAKYETEGWFRRGARNLWTLIRYFCGVSPEQLSQSYRRSGRRS